MMKRALLSTVALATTAVSMTFATPTYAWGGCNCWNIHSYHETTRDVVRAENKKVREQVKSSIEQQTDELRDHLDVKTTELIEALKGQARENSNYQQMQVEANQRIEDAAQVNATNRLRDEFRAKAESGEFDPNPFSCLLMDLFGDSSGGGGGSSATNGTDIVNQASGWISGNHPAIVAGGTTLSKHVVEEANKFAGYKGSPDAATDWGVMLRDPTVDFSDPQMAEVAKLIVQNTIDSTPDRPVTAEELLTPAGLDRAAKMLEVQGRSHASAESMAMAMNMIASVMEGSPVETYKDMADDSAYRRAVNGKLSELQQIGIMTAWNYAPRGERMEALTNVSGMSEKAWLFELHRVMSLNARINYLQLELASRDAIVNASILATLNDDD